MAHKESWEPPASGTSLAILDALQLLLKSLWCLLLIHSPLNLPKWIKKGGFYARTAPSDLITRCSISFSYLVDDGRDTSVSIISRADSYGRGLAEATASSAFEALGGNTVDTIVYHHATDASEFSMLK